MSEKRGKTTMDDERQVQEDQEVERQLETMYQEMDDHQKEQMREFLDEQRGQIRDENRSYREWIEEDLVARKDGSGTDGADGAEPSDQKKRKSSLRDRINRTGTGEMIFLIGPP